MGDSLNRILPKPKNRNQQGPFRGQPRVAPAKYGGLPPPSAVQNQPTSAQLQTAGSAEASVGQMLQELRNAVTLAGTVKQRLDQSGEVPEIAMYLGTKVIDTLRNLITELDRLASVHAANTTELALQAARRDLWPYTSNISSHLNEMNTVPAFNSFRQRVLLPLAQHIARHPVLKDLQPVWNNMANSNLINPHQLNNVIERVRAENKRLLGALYPHTGS